MLDKFRFVLVGTTVLLALATIGCTSNNLPTLTTPPTTPNPTLTPNQTQTSSPMPALTPTPTSSSFNINFASKAIIGNYLVDSRRMTLYYTVSDKPGYSNLPDETLSVWPTFYTPNILVPPSIEASDFGTYKRDNNVKQTTYKGYPLYYFFQDMQPGDTLGNKAGGVWFVVNPDNFPP